MGFTLSKKGDPKRVWWPVTIQAPRDGGGSVQHKVELQYEIVAQDVIDELTAQNDLVVLRRVIVGWKGFQDDEGNELGFSDEHKELALQVPYVRTALLQGYFMAAVGGRRKN